MIGEAFAIIDMYYDIATLVLGAVKMGFITKKMTTSSV